MISVIVPVYNVEDYLEACVDSILNSTFTDFELILVDDGSADRSGAICDEYQEKDKRVIVIHQPNAGVSAARNKGLKVSKGDYITFVDSDDLVHPRMLEVLWNAIKSGDYDMSVVLMRIIGPNEGAHYLNLALNDLGDVTPRSFAQKDYVALMFTNYKGFYLGVWCKLYKRSLIFQENDTFLAFKPIHAEDVEWLTRVVLCLKNYVMISLSLYFYNERSDSLTHSDSENMMNDTVVGRLDTHYKCLNLIPTSQPKYRAMCLKDLYNRIRLYSYIARGTSYQEETDLQCKKIYKETIREYLLAPINPLGKMRNLLFYHCPWLYQMCISLIGSLAKIIKH